MSTPREVGAMCSATLGEMMAMEATSLLRPVRIAYRGNLVAGGSELWNGPTDNRTLPAVGTVGAVTIVSDSGLDTAAGTGAQAVRIEYMDPNGWLRFVDVATNGAVPVVAAVNAYRVLRIVVTEVGVTGSNAGTLTALIEIAATPEPQLLVAPTENLSHAMVYTVPRGWMAMMSKLDTSEFDFDGTGIDLQRRSRLDPATMNPWLTILPLAHLGTTRSRLDDGPPRSASSFTDIRLITLGGTLTTLFSAVLLGKLIVDSTDVDPHPELQPPVI